jgi:hypothetical protein
MNPLFVLLLFWGVGATEMIEMSACSEDYSLCFDPIHKTIVSVPPNTRTQLQMRERAGKMKAVCYFCNERSPVEHLEKEAAELAAALQQLKRLKTRAEQERCGPIYPDILRIPREGLAAAGASVANPTLRVRRAVVPRRVIGDCASQASAPGTLSPNLPDLQSPQQLPTFLNRDSESLEERILALKKKVERISDIRPEEMETCEGYREELENIGRGGGGWEGSTVSKRCLEDTIRSLLVEVDVLSNKKNRPLRASTSEERGKPERSEKKEKKKAPLLRYLNELRSELCTKTNVGC